MICKQDQIVKVCRERGKECEKGRGGRAALSQTPQTRENSTGVINVTSVNQLKTTNRLLDLVRCKLIEKLIDSFCKTVLITFLTGCDQWSGVKSELQRILLAIRWVQQVVE